MQEKLTIPYRSVMPKVILQFNNFLRFDINFTVYCTCNPFYEHNILRQQHFKKYY